MSAGGNDHEILLLDTPLGTIYWPECEGKIHRTSQTKVMDDAYDYAPENEAEWRGEAPAWGISDFFGVLKNQFRELKFIPISSRHVVDVYTSLAAGTDGMVEIVQEIFREHGWPNLDHYLKDDYLQAVHAAIKERHPGFEDWMDKQSNEHA